MATVHFTRRQILQTVIASAAAAPAFRLLAAPQAAPEPAGNAKLADDLYIVRVPGEAAVVAQTGPNGVVLIDGGSAAGSDAAHANQFHREPNSADI